MRAAWMIGCLAALTGCFVLPAEHTTVRPVDEKFSAWVPAQPTTPDLLIQSIGLQIALRAQAPRECTRKRFEIRDVTRVRTAELAVPPYGSGSIIELLVAPITLTISGAITVLVLWGEKPHTTRETKEHPERMSCPIRAANFRVTATFPSGATLGVTSDDNGIVSFAVPESEPDVGTVVVTGGLRPRPVSYDRRPRELRGKDDAIRVEQTCKASRSAAMLRAQEIVDIKDRTAALIALPHCADE